MHALCPDVDAVCLRLIWVFQLILRALATSSPEPDLGSGADARARDIADLIKRLDQIILSLTEAPAGAAPVGTAQVGIAPPQTTLPERPGSPAETARAKARLQAPARTANQPHDAARHTHPPPIGRWRKNAPDAAHPAMCFSLRHHNKQTGRRSGDAFLNGLGQQDRA